MCEKQKNWLRHVSEQSKGDKENNLVEMQEHEIEGDKKKKPACYKY